MLMDLCESWHLASAIAAASLEKKRRKKNRTRAKRLERQEVRVTMCVNMGDKERGETEIEGDKRREMDVLGDIV